MRRGVNHAARAVRNDGLRQAEGGARDCWRRVRRSMGGTRRRGFRSARALRQHTPDLGRLDCGVRSGPRRRAGGRVRAAERRRAAVGCTTRTRAAGADPTAVAGRGTRCGTGRARTRIRSGRRWWRPSACTPHVRGSLAGGHARLQGHAGAVGRRRERRLHSRHVEGTPFERGKARPQRETENESSAPAARPTMPELSTGARSDLVSAV
jgi:hypothetical protein